MSWGWKEIDPQYGPIIGLLASNWAMGVLRYEGIRSRDTVTGVGSMGGLAPGVMEGLGLERSIWPEARDELMRRNLGLEDCVNKNPYCLPDIPPHLELGVRLRVLGMDPKGEMIPDVDYPRTYGDEKNEPFGVCHNSLALRQAVLYQWKLEHGGLPGWWDKSGKTNYLLRVGIVDGFYRLAVLSQPDCVEKDEDKYGEDLPEGPYVVHDILELKEGGSRRMVEYVFSRLPEKRTHECCKVITDL